MSSNSLDNGGRAPRNPAERILMSLKMQGSQSASELGKKLKITGEAVRQQLIRLADQRMVSAENVSSGVGRPKQIWSLTPEAQSRFPDTHANLTVQLLETVSSVLGEDALDAIIDQRERDTREHYETAMSDRLKLSERVAALVELRSEEGYMASLETTDDGSFLLIENHCPICAAASFCQGFCRTELALFRSLLGPDVTVDRSEHMIKGARRCAYIIKEDKTEKIHQN